MPARATYVHGHDESVLRSHRYRTVANSATYLADHLRPDTTVLDVGCGPGTITADFARLVSPGRVTAVDSSAEVLEAARAELGQTGLTNVAFQPADVHALDFPDHTFDVVHAHQVLQHVADPVLALREMRRVCVPGGMVAARDADYAAMTWYPEVPELDEWQELYQRTARAGGGEPDAGRRLLAWAREAGFTEITPSASSWCHATVAEREWWGGLWADRIVNSAFATQAVAHGFATPADLARIADGWREWGQRPQRLVRHPARRDPVRRLDTGVGVG